MNLQRRNENDGSFHRAMSKVLLMGNFVGLPIIGILSHESTRVHYKMKSFQGVYSIYLFIMSILMLVSFMVWICLTRKVSIQNCQSILVFSRNLITLILFQRLARLWNSFVRKWTAVEEFVPILNKQHEGKCVKRRLTILQIFIFSISIGKLTEID
jgi:hypothetical protein